MLKRVKRDIYRRETGVRRWWSTIKLKATNIQFGEHSVSTTKKEFKGGLGAHQQNGLMLEDHLSGPTRRILVLSFSPFKQ